MSEIIDPPLDTPPIEGVIVLQKAGDLLIANFVPPIPKGTPARKSHDGHPPLSPIERDEHGGIVRLTYEKDSFGWSKDEREKDFIKYNHKQARRLGNYVVASDTVEKVELKVKPRVISSAARHGKKAKHGKRH